MAVPPCELCGTPAGTGSCSGVFQERECTFCCMGCLNVYGILVASGALAAGEDPRTTPLFLQSLKLGIIAAPGGERMEPPPGAETREELYQLSGLWCTSCAWLVERALAGEPGIVKADVIFTSDLLRVTYCPQFLPPEVIPARVASLGYRALPYGAGDGESRREWQDLVLRLGMAFGLWMNVMLFSLVVYASFFGSIAEGARKGVPFILLALALPVATWSAWPIHRLAWFGLKQGRLRLEALISTGVLAAFVYSAVQAWQGGRNLYFDTACAIVTLMLAGKALERSAKERSARALAMLHRLLPRKARIRVEGEDRFVAIEALVPGVVFRVLAGERIPADGIILEGASSLDESVVTGESEPCPRGPGDAVVCGALNGHGILDMRVTHGGEDSSLARIVQAVEGALARRSGLERAVDRVARLFIPGVLVLALGTLLGCLAQGHSGPEAMLRSIAVLVIACPCALGIATPLATTTAVGTASRRGILIRDVGVLETFRKVDVVVLDKTGTVTEGVFRVREAALERLDLVASLEACSEHPLGRAVAAHAREGGQILQQATEVEIRPGLGLAGLVGGARVVVGNRTLLELEGAEPTPAMTALASGWQGEGLTVVFAAVDGVPAGALALGDAPRAGAAELVRALQARGVRTLLLSGDARTTTLHMGRRLGIDSCLGEVLPGHKAEAIRNLQAKGAVVAMVGDGVNDAPALAQADLGIALGSGADLAMHAAPVVLLGPDLLRIETTFRLAERTVGVIRQNLFWAFVYNAAGITLAMTGVLNPIWAAGAMVLSSLSVIGNSLRLGKA